MYIWETEAQRGKETCHVVSWWPPRALCPDHLSEPQATVGCRPQCGCSVGTVMGFSKPSPPQSKPEVLTPPGSWFIWSSAAWSGTAQPEATSLACHVPGRAPGTWGREVSRFRSCSRVKGRDGGGLREEESLGQIIRRQMPSPTSATPTPGPSLGSYGDPGWPQPWANTSDFFTWR